MVALFKRDYSLVLDDILITKLDITFKVTRNLKREPNTAEITVKNLSPEHRRQLEERADVRVSLEAGYVSSGFEFGVGGTFASGRSLIFAGDLREVTTERMGADLITKISSGDGEKRHRRSRINRGFGPGTSIRTVIEACAEALGVGVGNLRELGSPEFPGAGAIFPNGTVLSGNAAEELGAILRSAGYTYSIQDGNLQILRRGTALAGTAVVLSSATGMIDTPSISSDGTLRARTLMIPDLFPGRKVEFRGENLTGLAKVEVAEYTGDTAGNDWFIDIECKRVNA